MMQRREFLGHMVRTTAAAGAVMATRHSAWAFADMPPGTSRRASVVDFGADPTGQKDATEAVQKAIASLAKRNARLVFPAGKYIFAASDTALMSFHDYEGLEIFGNGAELSFAGATQPLTVTGCKDLEIHDIIVDWIRPHFSQGTVRAVGDRSVTVAVDPDFPINGSEHVQALLGFSGKGATVVPTGENIYGVVSVQSRGAQLLEVSLAERPRYKAGMRLVLLHPVGGAAAIRLDGCEEVLLETVMFHASSGPAVLLSGCHDISLDTVRVMPHPGSGRLISSCGGGIEILDCSGSVTAQHALISATAGAGLRVQQSYWRLTETPEPQVAVVASADGRPVPASLLPIQGTYLQLSEAGTLQLLGEIAVTKAEPAPGGMKLTFEETLSPTIGKGTLFCLSAVNQPQMKLDDCKFTGGPYAGIVAQSRARINSSSFTGYAGPAILMAPDVERMRGPVVEGIHITECSFTQCSLATSEPVRGTVIVANNPEAPESGTPAHRGNEGITLQRNTFSHLGCPAIYCADASWVDIESNHFDSCDMAHAAGATPRAIVLRNLNESTVTLNDAKAAATIVMVDCTDKVKAGDNGLLTNAAS